MKLVKLLNKIFKQADFQEIVDPGKQYVTLNNNEPHPYHPVERHGSHQFGACDL